MSLKLISGGAAQALRRSCASVGPMDGRPISLRIAGQSYKVVSSSSEEELQRLAGWRLRGISVSADKNEFISAG